MRIEPAGDGEIHTEQELRLLLGQSAESGSIESDKHELIENVFSFDDRKVRKIMVPRTRISGLDNELSLDEMADRIVEEGYSRMPVYADSIDHIIGILYTKDLFRHIHRGTAVNIDSLLRPAYFIPENKKISELLREFQQNKSLMAVVVDEFGGTSGLVTLEDILEELVGEIEDELDQAETMFHMVLDNVWHANAAIPISELNDQLPVPIPESGDYDTLGGFLISLSGVIPDDGEAVEWEQYEFISLKTTDIAIEEVEIRYSPVSENKED
jgi:CBS domain containing-hemolysin-like protein